MKKPQYKMLLYYVVALLIMGIAAYVTPLLYGCKPAWAQLPWGTKLLLGVGLMLGALAVHLLSRKKALAYLLSYFLNAMASGWIVGTLMYEKQMIPAPELFAAFIPAILFGILTCMLFSMSENKRTTVISIVVLVSGILLLLAGIAVWIWVAPLIGCVFVFSALYLLPFPIGVGCAQETPDEAFRYLSLTGFGAFALILLVAIFILSEGDGLDGLDLGGGEGKKRKKK